MKYEIVQTEQPRTVENKRAFIRLYKVHTCNISLTCEAVGIGRTAYYHWYNNDKAFKNCIDELNKALIDWAESRLYANIRRGNTRSLIFFLTNRDPKRWQDKKNFTGEIKGGDTTIHVHPQKVMIFKDLKKEKDVSDDGSTDNSHVREGTERLRPSKPV